MNQNPVIIDTSISFGCPDYFNDDEEVGFLFVILASESNLTPCTVAISSTAGFGVFPFHPRTGAVTRVWSRRRL